MGSGEWKCGELYGKHIEGVEADFPNQALNSCNKVLLNRSTIPSPCGWYEVVRDLTIPNAEQVFFNIVLSKFLP